MRWRGNRKVLEGFLTLMIPYLKTSVRSEYSVQAFVKQKPSVSCDLVIRMCPTGDQITSEKVDSDGSVLLLHHSA